MSEKIPLTELRKGYGRGELGDDAVRSAPLEQFSLWFEEAVANKAPEPNAMTVATVGADGRPSTRPVLLKHFDEHGIVWFTNYHSRKGRDLEHNPFAALQFHWSELERVVRIEGRMEKVLEEESDAYFDSRPLANRIGAWASPQSEIIRDRGVIVARAAEYGLKYGIRPPRPPHWGGYRLVPDYWEFWQGRASRLHDRIVFMRQEDGGWTHARLAP